MFNDTRIDVSEISGSERLGRVVESDIKKFAAIKINNPNKIQKKKNQSLEEHLLDKKENLKF